MVKEVDSMISGQWLTRARKQRGLSQKSLAIALGVSPITVNRWERGTRTPSLLMIEKIALQLRMTIAELLGA